MKPKVEITRQCSLCEIGRPSPNGKNILCVKNGIMSPDSVCRKFRYDPLKREPKLAEKRQYSKSDFEL